MKIIVAGGTGLVGSRLVRLLQEQGHEAVAASPSTGVDTVSGEGLAAVLAGAGVLVDVTNAPTFAPDAVRDFFERSTRNLCRAGKEAGVGHHIVLSIVGADRLPDNPYYSAKTRQEELVREGGVPYTILRATQFMEFLLAIGLFSEAEGAIRLPPALLQPVAADDVAAALAALALAPPLQETTELAGPAQMPMEHAVRRALTAAGEKRQILLDPQARYFGSRLEHDALVPAEGSAPRLGALRFEDWLRR